MANFAPLRLPRLSSPPCYAEGGEFPTTRLKLRQARKVAKALGIAQKVNGRDQKLEFLRSQIKVKLQQAKLEILQVVKQELLAC